MNELGGQSRGCGEFILFLLWMIKAIEFRRYSTALIGVAQ